jgi:hypothetical protein
MCAFWYAHFVEFVAQYEAVLRIDEDCFVRRTSRADPRPPAGTPLASPLVWPDMDDAEVIDGLVPLAERLSAELQLPPLRQWRSPYTNVFWISVPYALSAGVQNIVRRARETNCIMTNRWATCRCGA